MPPARVARNPTARGGNRLRACILPPVPPTPNAIFDHSSPWPDRLAIVLDLVRAMSRETDPQRLFETFVPQARRLIPTDRSFSVSRRDLDPPRYRITRSGLWAPDAPNPWTQREKLPTCSGGLVADWLYAGRPRVIDDLTVPRHDAAAEHLDGMRSALAIPHFIDAQPLSMVIHLRSEPHAFDPDEFPELVLLSNLFGRATHGLVLAQELSEARAALQETLHSVSTLSDTVLEQALLLRRDNKSLEEQVRQRTCDLRQANLDALYMLAQASEAKDEDTGRHVMRLESMTRDVARHLGFGEADAESIGHAAILHDVGKMHVPDHILKKPGPLTAAERALMQEHTLAGERILSDRPFFAAARRVCRSHHENWDGSGYPDRLSGESIPLEARIVHVADVFDALISRRVYKDAWPRERAVAEIAANAGTMFDARIVAAFQRVVASATPD